MTLQELLAAASQALADRDAAQQRLDATLAERGKAQQVLDASLVALGQKLVETARPKDGGA